ncbi:MAG: hypothetical protein JSS34_06335 [Proteobacteria bacterium]|nr:hypothetical protein [Pseudomonadota bacterium]
MQNFFKSSHKQNYILGLIFGVIFFSSFPSFAMECDDKPGVLQTSPAPKRRSLNEKTIKKYIRNACISIFYPFANNLEAETKEHVLFLKSIKAHDEVPSSDKIDAASHLLFSSFLNEEEKEEERRFLQDLQQRESTPFEDKVRIPSILGLWDSSERFIEKSPTELEKAQELKRKQISFLETLQKRETCKTNQIQIACKLLSVPIYCQDAKDQQLSLLRDIFESDTVSLEVRIDAANGLMNYSTLKEEQQKFLKFLKEMLASESAPLTSRIDVALDIILWGASYDDTTGLPKDESSLKEARSAQEFLFSLFQNPSLSFSSQAEVAEGLLFCDHIYKLKNIEKSKQERLYSFFLKALTDPNTTPSSFLTALRSLCECSPESFPSYRLKGQNFLLSRFERNPELFIEDNDLQALLEDVSAQVQRASFQHRLWSLLLKFLELPQTEREDIAACIRIAKNIISSSDAKAEDKERGYNVLLVILEAKGSSLFFAKRIELINDIVEYGNSFQKEKSYSLLKSWCEKDPSFSKALTSNQSFLRQINSDFNKIKREEGMPSYLPVMVDVALLLLEDKAKAISTYDHEQMVGKIFDYGNEAQREQCCALLSSNISACPDMPFKMYVHDLKMVFAYGTQTQQDTLTAHLLTQNSERRQDVVTALISYTEAEMRGTLILILNLIKNTSLLPEDITSYLSFINSVECIIKIEATKTLRNDVLLHIFENDKTPIDSWNEVVRDIFRFGTREEKERVTSTLLNILHNPTSPLSRKISAAERLIMTSRNEDVRREAFSILMNISQNPDTSQDIQSRLVRIFSTYGTPESLSWDHIQNFSQLHSGQNISLEQRRDLHNLIRPFFGRLTRACHQLSQKIEATI